MSNDYIYWTFSAASQSIAAFVAFLLTGYALVHALMEAAREKDDSLEEVHTALKHAYHNQLTLLAWLTGAAIVLSLLLVYLNRSDATVSIWLVAAVSVVDLAAVVLGLTFVVSIVNPKKYQIAAKKALEQVKQKLDPSDQRTSAAEFFDAFTHLERLIRDYLRRRKLYVPSRGVPRMSFSFRQMIESLLQNEKIDSRFFDELMEINKYRNLVFHGHVDNADPSMVSRVRDASRRFEQLSDLHQ